ncbi:hypothetical protein HG537_0B00730 [Torulaspora globosa]|uniref:Multicopper oxidase n=1 Tax=Torulaspora globosa TaxID=48254 RepID=A0A7H9HLQ1_9SACH|nr:hypothetical protein HG537_0B00730 [Torulaspora sp. CBS 2947]
MIFQLVFVIATLLLHVTVAGSGTEDGKSTQLLDFDITSSFNEAGRRIISINGHDNTYGPTIRVKAGETINLKVQNHICTAKEALLGEQDLLWREFCDTALHFHGLVPIGNENDGVPGLVQDAIKTGDIYWYNFTIPANVCGTFWYHSHSSVQYGDGLRGIVIVECPEYDSLARAIANNAGIDEVETPGPFKIDEAETNDVGPAMEEQIISLSDWYSEFDLDVMRDKVMAYDGTTDPHIDGSLINGSEEQDIEFTLAEDTEVIVLRIINTGMSGTQIFHLEDHKMIIMETDGILVKPYVVETLSMAVGQRVTVMVHLNEDVISGNRALKIVNGCNKMMGYITKTAWFVKEKGANAKSSTKANIKYLPGLNKHELYRELEPHDSTGITGLWESDDIQRIELEYSYHSDKDTKNKFYTGMYKVNGKVFDEYYTDPIILNNGQVAEITINAKDHMRHPWHLHGQPFQVVSLGAGREGPLNLQSPDTDAARRYQQDLQFWRDNNRTPMTRDSINIPGNSYAALRIKSEFQGKWLLHCHVDWHIAKGLGVVLEILPENAKNTAEISTDKQDPSAQPTQPTNRLQVLLVYFLVMVAINTALYKLLM